MPKTRFFWNRPAKEDLKSFMDAVADADFNHDRVGLTYSLPGGMPDDEFVSIKGVRHQRAMLQGWRVVRMQVGRRGLRSTHPNTVFSAAWRRWSMQGP